MTDFTKDSMLGLLLPNTSLSSCIAHSPAWRKAVTVAKVSHMYIYIRELHLDEPFLKQDLNDFLEDGQEA